MKHLIHLWFLRMCAVMLLPMVLTYVVLENVLKAFQSFWVCLKIDLYWELKEFAAIWNDPF